ncbi:Phosphatidylinositol 4,5-bisphosphate 3-kinase catalytic subunit gamma isoform [Balamuthia mandrillaris]
MENGPEQSPASSNASLSSSPPATAAALHITRPTFQLMVVYAEDGTQESFTLSTRATVDHVKTHLINHSVKLANLTPQQKQLLKLQLPHGEILAVEFARFANHKTLYESILLSGQATIHCLLQHSSPADRSSSSSSKPPFLRSTSTSTPISTPSATANTTAKAATVTISPTKEIAMEQQQQLANNKVEHQSGQKRIEREATDLSATRSTSAYLYSFLSSSPRNSLGDGETEKREVEIELTIPPRCGASSSSSLSSLQLRCDTTTTLKELKELVTRTAHDSNIEFQSPFAIKVSRTHQYLNGDTTPLHEFPVFQFCLKKNRTARLTVVERGQSKQEKLASLQIGSLIGRPLCWDSTDNNQTTYFRSRMHEALSVRHSRKKTRKSKPSNEGEEEHEQLDEETRIPPPTQTNGVYAKLTFAPLPPDFPEKFLIRVYLPDGKSFKTLDCIAQQKIEDVLLQVRRKAHRYELNADGEYLLKISGYRQYVLPHENLRLQHLEYVRECLKRRQKVTLVVVSTDGLVLEEAPSYYLEALNQQYNQLPDSNDKNSNNTKQSARTSSKARKSGHGRSNEEGEKGFAKVYRYQSALPLFALKRPFEIKVCNADNVSVTTNAEDSAIISYYVEAALYFGDKALCSEQCTFSATPSTVQSITWNQWLRFSIPTCDLPLGTRLCFTLNGKDSRNTVTPIGWVNHLLFDYDKTLCTGDTACLWAKTLPRSIELVWPIQLQEQPPFCTSTLRRIRSRIPIPSQQEQQLLQKLASGDPLLQLSSSDKMLLWKYRAFCMELSPYSLIKIMQSVPWTEPTQVRYAYRMLEECPLLSPVDALELLDAKFADEKVRKYAVLCLQELNDEQLAAFLPQLVQVLKYEPYHYSELARFLLERSLRSLIAIGHHFFWHLQGEMHVPEINERFGLLLEFYLRECGPTHRQRLLEQMDVIKKMQRVAISMKSVPLARRNAALREELAKLELPSVFALPLDPTIEVTGIQVDRCKCMDSAKVPLWLAFKNADTTADEPVFVIFKSGDDLRQDLLTLQMLRIMDHVWKVDNLDLHLTPYKCIATGDSMGMIEVVLNSDTVANIQKAAGGATAAFKQTPLSDWLRQNNPNEKDYDEAVRNFVRSCAGYCVATYVLGIGDRLTPLSFYIRFWPFSWKLQVMERYSAGESAFCINTRVCLCDGRQRPQRL